MTTYIYLCMHIYIYIYIYKYTYIYTNPKHPYTLGLVSVVDNWAGRFQDELDYIEEVVLILIHALYVE
jgi:ABC-type dipeptide/oligopeptide/nickel transport system ATPase component